MSRVSDRFIQNMVMARQSGIKFQPIWHQAKVRDGMDSVWVRQEIDSHNATLSGRKE